MWIAAGRSPQSLKQTRPRRPCRPRSPLTDVTWETRSAEAYRHAMRSIFAFVLVGLALIYLGAGAQDTGGPGERPGHVWFLYGGVASLVLAGLIAGRRIWRK